MCGQRVTRCVVELHQPFAGLPSPAALLALGDPQPGAAPEQLGDEFGGTARRTAPGPSRSFGRAPGAEQEVARWDDYPGPLTSWIDNRGPAHLDGVRWLPIVDEGERAAALEAGRVDCVQNPSLLEVERLRSNPELSM